jgi:hypothetical protein
VACPVFYRIRAGSAPVLDGFNLPMEKAAVTFWRAALGNDGGSFALDRSTMSDVLPSGRRMRHIFGQR